MKYLPRCAAALFAFSLIALSAGPAPAVVMPAHGHGGGSNLSGQYTGTVTDSVLGTGTASANFAGAPGGLGGWIAFTFGTAVYANPTIAGPDFSGGQGDWGRGGGGGVRGIFVATVASTACTFGFKASYDASSFVLSGEYKAVNGCSGENGSFSLTQQCYYQERGSLRRNVGLGGC